MRLFLLAFTTLVATAVAVPARAEEGGPSRDDDQALLALALGATTAIGPMAIGGARAGRRDLSHAARDQGWVAAASGLTLAPLTAHLVTREYGRAAAFTATPAAATIAISSLLLAKPDAIYTGNPASRVSFTLLFVLCVAGSAAGVVDAAFAPERKKKLKASPPVAFDVGPGSLHLRGVW